jgi:hypothetical protein
VASFLPGLEDGAALIGGSVVVQGAPAELSGGGIIGEEIVVEFFIAEAVDRDNIIRVSELDLEVG